MSPHARSFRLIAFLVVLAESMGEVLDAVRY